MVASSNLAVPTKFLFSPTLGSGVAAPCFRVSENSLFSAGSPVANYVAMLNPECAIAIAGELERRKLEHLASNRQSVEHAISFILPKKD